MASRRNSSKGLSLACLIDSLDEAQLKLLEKYIERTEHSTMEAIEALQQCE